MSSFFTWLTECVAGDRPSRSRPRSSRPTLESLDDRIMPSVSYHGGPVLSHVDVHTVFYGQNWNTSDSYGIGRYSLDKFLGDVTKSPYMAMLGEYGVGRGSWGGYDDVTDSSSPTTNVKESQIQSMLSLEMARGHLPWEQGQQLYIVYLAPNVKSQWDQKSSFNKTGSLGHHGSFWDPVTRRVEYYAVIVDPSAWPSGNLTALNNFQKLTEVTSHELAEAATNPDVRLSDSGVSGGGSSAWWDSDQFNWNGPGFVPTPNPTYQQEIGDIVNQQYVTNFVANGTTYTVQQEWSNYFGKGIVANGSQSWMLDYSTTNHGQFSDETFVSWNNGGRTVNERYATGWDKRTYHTYDIDGGGQSGWFTIDG